MLFSKRAKTERGIASRGDNSPARLALDHDNWRRPQEPQSDWKKVLLLTGLGTLSWISTYTGMLELIQANMGGIGFTYKIAIGFAVAMLMLMIIWLLDRLFDRLQFPVRVLYVTGYLFLTLISVGFGFGFYWKFLESRSEATRSAESAVTQVQSALQGAQTRMEQLQTTLTELTTLSAKKAIEEREKGNSCPNSRPGDGPRRRLRDADASRFGFAGKFVEQRIGSVKSDINTLNTDLKKVIGRDQSTFSAKDGTRNAFMKDLGRKLDLAVTRFNAFRTDPQLIQFRNDFAERSTKTVFDNGRGATFKCPDPELQSALKGVVRAIDKLPELEKPKVAVVEGSEAILEAFRRLTTTLYGAFQLKFPPTPDELRTMQQRAVQSIENVATQRRIMSLEAGLGDRDYVPLFIAIFVDFCLLLVSVSRPMSGFQWLDQRMSEAQEWPVMKILSRFRDVHQDEQIREVFEVFRHVVFDWRGVYYAAIPVNGTDPTFEGKMSSDAAVQAQLLTNLFTSFENEGVYTRTPVPFFTSNFIRRKLRDQGSKFSEGEAFRVYRFRKDMWQDWMLSAMMGAAKRVEVQKRTETVGGGVFADRDQPSLVRAPDEHRSRRASVRTAVQTVSDLSESEINTDNFSELEDAVANAVDETLQSLQNTKVRRAATAEMLDDRLVVNGQSAQPTQCAPASVCALYPNGGQRQSNDIKTPHRGSPPGNDFREGEQESKDVIHRPASIYTEPEREVRVTNARDAVTDERIASISDHAKPTPRLKIARAELERLPAHVVSLASTLSVVEDASDEVMRLDDNQLLHATSTRRGEQHTSDFPTIDVTAEDRTKISSGPPGQDIDVAQLSDDDMLGWSDEDQDEPVWAQPDIQISDIAQWFANDPKSDATKR